MAKQEDGPHRPHVPPEQTSINVGRQVPAAPHDDGDDERLGADQLDPSDQPAIQPDSDDNGPVFDLAEAPPALFDRDDMDPDAERDDGDEVEIHHKPAR